MWSAANKRLFPEPFCSTRKNSVDAGRREHQRHKPTNCKVWGTWEYKPETVHKSSSKWCQHNALDHPLVVGRSISTPLPQWYQVEHGPNQKLNLHVICVETSNAHLKNKPVAKADGTILTPSPLLPPGGCLARTSNIMHTLTLTWPRQFSPLTSSPDLIWEEAGKRMGNEQGRGGAHAYVREL